MKNIIENIKYKEILSLILFFLTIIIIIKSSFFLPIIISIIITYFLYNIQKLLTKINISNSISFIITYSLFLTSFILILTIILPIIFKQLANLFDDLPIILQKIKILTYKYPLIFSIEQTNILFSNITTYVQSIGKTLISASLISIAIIIKWTISIFIIPILVLFLLKDHKKILEWFNNIMPEKMRFWKNIWIEINKQIENYIRGKIIEIIIITIANYILFKIYKISYADLLSLIVGLSVIIPYIGAIMVSIPVILISAVQLGISQEFFYITIIYTTIQLLDGNILVPLLFSEAVNLHPISIIIAVIVFGSTLNIYGVFFAIPFAIVIKAIINIHLKH
ncbi:MAG TPA: AI-2E family transporter [Candidatus Azoamicus sp.]